MSIGLSPIYGPIPDLQQNLEEKIVGPELSRQTILVRQAVEKIPTAWQPHG